MLTIESKQKLAFGVQKNNADSLSVPKPSTTNALPKSILVKPSLDHIKANFLTFKGKLPVDKKSGEYTYSLETIVNDLDAQATETWNRAVQLAKTSKSKEVTPMHYLYWSVYESAQALANNEDGYTPLLRVLKKGDPALFQSEKLRKTVLDTLLDLSRNLKGLIEAASKHEGQSITDPIVSDSLRQILETAHQKASENPETAPVIVVSEEEILLKIISDRGSPASNLFMQCIHDLALRKDADKKESTALVKRDPRTAPVASSPVRSSFTSGASDDESVANLSGKPQEDLYSFDHYNQRAKVLGPIISGGKNALVGYQSGSMPELLAHGFTNMLHNSEFKDLDLSNTKVNYIDTAKLMAGSEDATTEILKFAREAKQSNKHHVLFIKDYDILIGSMMKQVMYGKGKHPALVFNPAVLGDKVHIVGMMKSSMFKALTNTEHLGFAPEVHQLREFLKDSYEKIELTSPSPKKALAMMKEDSKLLNGITSKYGDVVVTAEGLDKAIEVATNSRTSAMPGAALDLLNFVIAAKANATGNAVGSIGKEDVERYVKEYPELRQSPASGSGQFSVIHETGVTMKDVGGAAQAKEVVEELLDFIKNPNKFTKIGAKMPKGILLSGSPGNGKTHLAKAIAGEAGVPFISVSGSEFIEKYVGVGAARVREVFDFARAQARATDNKTAIIFVDEFDALGRARGGDNGGGGREAEQTLNQLLVEMDGLSKNTDVNIVVLAATNRLDLLDTALTDRPGRFDHKIEVPNPANDTQARYEILNIHARKHKIAGDREKVLREVASGTSGSSGARLADIVNKAVLIAAKDNREELTVNDFIEAKLESIAGRVHKTNKPAWYDEIVIAHECGHALVRQIMLNMVSKPWEKANEIDLITTDARGRYGGAVYNKPGENVTQTFESIFSELASKFGGYSVEKSRFGIKGSHGITSDLQNATALAKAAVTEMGMGPNTGVMSVAGDSAMAGLMSSEIKEDMKLLLNHSAKVSDLIVEFFGDFIEKYVTDHQEKAGKGGNNLSGEEFKNKLNAWVKETGKEQELVKLQQRIQKILQATKDGKPEEANKRRIGFIQD